MFVVFVGVGSVPVWDPGASARLRYRDHVNCPTWTLYDLRMASHESGCGCDQCRRVSDYIQRLVDEAPPLTPDQRTKLAELLAPVRRTATE